jgi:hypothetical protein
MKSVLLISLFICSSAFAQMSVTPLQVQCAEQPAINSNDSVLVYGQMAYNIEGSTRIEVARFQGWSKTFQKESSSAYKNCQKIKKAMSLNKSLRLRTNAYGEILDLSL